MAGSAPINVEQLFDYAAYDIELWRMRQQLCRVNRRAGSTPWNTAEDIKAWLGYMEEALHHAVWQAQCGAALDVIKPFACELLPSDVVVTFNYDTLLENALTATGQGWNHGLEDSSDGGTRVLKMHGSVDWIMFERRPETGLEKFRKLFSKRDVRMEEADSSPGEEREEHEYQMELWRVKDEDTCRAVFQMDHGGLTNFQYQLGMANLGSHKPLHKLVGSARTWVNAFSALKRASEIYAIGFSMSAYDRMTRFHLAGAMAEREQPLRKVVLVDPNAECLMPAYACVFGDVIEPIATGAEAVNWQQLLSASTTR